MESSKQFKKKGENLVKIHFYDEIRANASGGTLETAFHILQNRVVYKSLLGYDPLLKGINGEQSPNRISAKNEVFLNFIIFNTNTFRK